MNRNITKRVVSAIAPFLKKKGFSRVNNCFFKTDNDLAYCIELEAPTGTLYTTYYILPLYIPSQYRYFSYGSRLHAHKHATVLSICSDSSDQDVATWQDAFCNDYEHILSPFFDSLTFPHGMLQLIQSDADVSQQYLACTYPEFCRLCFYTFAYIGRKKEAQKAAHAYQVALNACTYLAPAIIQKQSAEIRYVLSLLSGDMASFFEETKAQTRLLCLKIHDKDV